MRGGAHLDVVGASVTVSPVSSVERRTTPPASSARFTAGAVGGEQRGLDRGHQLADLRAERPEVRHDRVVEQTFEVGDGLDALHVELVGDLGDDVGARASSPSGTTTTARRSGWRTLSLASVRAARPSVTSRRAASTSASRAASIADVVDVRPVGAGAPTRRTARGCVCSSSARNGQNGASSSVVTRQALVQRGVRAPGRTDFQKRGRERRTYQFDRSSTNASSACAPRSASKPSSAARDVAHRRSAGASGPSGRGRASARSAGAGAAARRVRSRRGSRT